MKRLTILITLMTVVATAAWGAANLNSSKSNEYRMTYPVDLVTKDQAQKLLAELDRMGRTDEQQLMQWLPRNFRRFGINGSRVKKLIVMPSDRDRRETTIILLTNPADEAAARSSVKSSKSNSSD